MRKLVLVAVAFASAAFTIPAAEATPTIQRRCSFTSITDPTVENGQTQAGQINGGPITDDTQRGATITITCTIQVGGANATHAGADSVSCAGSGTGVAEVACQASYVSPEGQPVYLCTQVTVNGTTYYWDASADPSDPNLPRGNWSLSGGLCNEAISQEIFPGPLAPVLDAIPVDAVVIISLPDGSEPIHTNVGASDCSTYTWDSMTGVYDVDCTTTARACSTVAAVAVGAPGLTGTASCGTVSVTAMSPVPPVATITGGMTPLWGCRLSGGPGGVVVCAIA